MTEAQTQTCHKCLRSDIHVGATRCPHCRALLGDKVPWWYGAISLVVVFVVLMFLLAVIKV